jgi:hypothetical protein
MKGKSTGQPRYNYINDVKRNKMQQARHWNEILNLEIWKDIQE